MKDKMSGNSNGTGSLVISGNSFIPIEGRSFNTSELEGLWELIELNGVALPQRSNLSLEAISKLKKEAAKAKESSDSAKKQNAPIFSQEKDEVRITPPQGGDYHIPNKPGLQFYGLNETFSGFTGCNKISGRYTVKDSTGISFNNPAPSTKMVCIGDYDETSFVNALNKVTTFRVTKNELQLLAESKPLLIFRRID